MTVRRLGIFASAVASLVALPLAAQYYDPPSRIGRLSDMAGSVSLRQADGDDWFATSLNYPVTSGDALWADAGSRAEVHFVGTAVRMGPRTSLVFDRVDDSETDLRLTEGSIDLRVKYLGSEDYYQIDTPDGVVWLLEEGHYRLDVTPDGRRTLVTVRDGSAEVSTGGTRIRVTSGSSAVLTGSGNPPYRLGPAIPKDSFEAWCDARNVREYSPASGRYVSDEMVGYEDLDHFGTWRPSSAYGAIWFPRNTPPGWAPYRYGRWDWIQPWGWTWIDDEPWGFAPYHYGRWAYLSGRWGWVPGSRRARPVYAPALVAFIGGDRWSVSLSLGGGGVGWVPLGPGEPYFPSYRASPTYVRNVNVTNVDITRINVTNININQVNYVNRTVPGAVTAVPRDVFERSRPVRQNAVQVSQAALAAAQASLVPIAGATPIPSRPREARVERERPGNAPVARPATPPPASAPREGRSMDRPRPRRPGSQVPGNVTQPTIPQPPPPPSRDDDRRGRGNNRQQDTPPPVIQPPQPPPPPAPPSRGDNTRGRGNDRRQDNPPPPVMQPPQPQPPPPAPPSRGDDRRGRGNDRRPDTPPPVVPTPPQPPPPPAPPSRGDDRRGRGNDRRQDTQPPVMQPPQPQPPPPAPPSRGDDRRGRGNDRRQDNPPATPAPPSSSPARSDTGRGRSDRDKDTTQSKGRGRGDGGGE